MTETLDVNVLLYAAQESNPFHARARQFLDHVVGGPAIFHVFWPVLSGYLRVATHPGIFDRPLSLAQATADVDEILGRPHLRVSGEDENFWPVYRQVCHDVGARGNLVPDAHIVALMHQHGVSTIWTHDRDFRKFSGINVKDPFAQLYSAGFG